MAHVDDMARVILEDAARRGEVSGTRQRIRDERLAAQRKLRRAESAAEVAQVVWDASGLLDHREVGGGVQIFAHRFLGGTGRTLRTVEHAEYNAALAALVQEEGDEER